MSYQVPNSPLGNQRRRKLILIIFLCLCGLSLPVVFFGHQTTKNINQFYFGPTAVQPNVASSSLTALGLIVLAVAIFFWSRALNQQGQASKLKYNLVLLLQLVSAASLTLCCWNLIYLFVYS